MNIAIRPFSVAKHLHEELPLHPLVAFDGGDFTWLCSISVSGLEFSLDGPGSQKQAKFLDLSTRFWRCGLSVNDSADKRNNAEIASYEHSWLWVAKDDVC
jgi:hypothetical protein